MKANSMKELLAHLEGVISITHEGVQIVAETAVADKIDTLVHTAVFSDGLLRDTARWIIWETALALGIYPASIHELYKAIGRGDVSANFTVPAMNVRAMNYDTSRAIFRAANKLDAGAMLFEIARSEMGYTYQRPAEYSACVLAAALKEGYRGPVFIQGDHFQISAGRYKSDPTGELQAIKDLIVEAIEGGFYNIDIDTSTLVDLSYPTLDEQQRENYALCAAITQFVRQVEPVGVTVSLGGEIGEVGHKNSTVEELHAFMQGYHKEVGAVEGISKISVQTGTSHGGVVLADGTLADVKVDFETLHDLSQVARESYGLGGAVQHGASTLPPSAFDRFPAVGTLEIHLATNFMNIVYSFLPETAVNEAYDYLRQNHPEEWKPGKTEEQSLYSARKRALGPFKEQWWHLDEGVRQTIAGALQNEFEFLFDKLNVKNTRTVAQAVTTRVDIHKQRPLAAAAAVEAEDVSDLAD